MSKITIDRAVLERVLNAILYSVPQTTSQAKEQLGSLLALRGALAQPQPEPMSNSWRVRTFRLPEEQEFIDAMRRRELRSTFGMTPAEIVERNAMADAVLDEILSSKPPTE